MAEFVQTMKNWRRMCKAQDDTTCGVCSSCPMGDDGKSCMAVYEDEFETVDFAHIEQTVTAWAAEHPEPVYPTWYEFMRENKIIPDVLEDCGDYYKTIGKWLVKATIKHDIAQKLGLQPKEVT